MVDIERSKTYQVIREILQRPKELLHAPNLHLSNVEMKWLQIGMVPRAVLIRALMRRNRRSTDKSIHSALLVLVGSNLLEITTEAGTELYAWKGEADIPSAVEERRKQDEWQALVLAAAVGILRSRAKHEPMARAMLEHIADRIEAYSLQVVKGE